MGWAARQVVADAEMCMWSALTCMTSGVWWSLARQYQRKHDGLIQLQRTFRKSGWVGRAEGRDPKSTHSFYGSRNASILQLVQHTLRISRHSHSRVTMIPTVSWRKKISVTESKSRVGGMADGVFPVSDQTGSNHCSHCRVHATIMTLQIVMLQQTYDASVFDDVKFGS